MAKDIIGFAILFIILVLLQVLLFNNIAIFNVAFPIIFIYLIIRLPVSLSLGYLFTFSFLLGLIIDIFSDTLGINALSCTLLAGIKRPAYFAYVDKDEYTEKLTPSVNSLGLATFSKYLLTMVAFYCFVVFIIEYFSFAGVIDLLIIASSSALLTFLCLLALDCLILRKT